MFVVTIIVTNLVEALTPARLQLEYFQAEVAELADALRSGRSELMLMRVRLPPSALKPRKGFFVVL